MTGAAGFIGSHLCERLLALGHEVVGIDRVGPHQVRGPQAGNLAVARQTRRFAFRKLDLAEAELRSAIDGADWVFHLAGRSGLGVAGTAELAEYMRDNVDATARLLEATVQIPIKRFIFAGSSSVYGDAERLPTRETATPRPLSTYGVTKLTAENLVHMYTRSYGLPATVLRYFTVYGPRQRPDMAIARFIQALSTGEELEIHGDGEQTRDFTFVDDVIEATVRSAISDVDPEVLNIGGGTHSTVNDVLSVLQHVSGRTVRCRHLSAPGPAERHSAASINLARQHLAWEPRIGLRDGLGRQWRWFTGAHEGKQELAQAAAV